MTNIQAADLPVGSVIATTEFAAFRLLDGPGYVWRTTKGSRISEEQVDVLLAAGAHVLRLGYEVAP